MQNIRKSEISIASGETETMEGKNYSTGKWTEEEDQRLFQALESFGNRWQLIEKAVGTRSRIQIRSHCQKYYRRKEKEQLRKLLETDEIKGKVFIVTKVYHQCATKEEIYKNRKIIRKPKPILYQDVMGMVRDGKEVMKGEEAELVAEDAEASFPMMEDFGQDVEILSLNSPRMNDMGRRNFNEGVANVSLLQFNGDPVVKRISNTAKNEFQHKHDIRIGDSCLY